MTKLYNDSRFAFISSVSSASFTSFTVSTVSISSTPVEQRSP
ncbi:3446_t:CDS:2 [Diversispora eburnea]|uniref:3446_t:CDS:1 n=1 Tax=Diversispora eburnea TaxID=1213867 RepID=A0A9N8WFU6_9GLOM|nr:3446_t:CDS:2 [Diversispora eburnea]